MANWATTDYVIEGPKETLDKINEAILHPIKKDDASEGWEGGVLMALGIDPEEKICDKMPYMRGFIQEKPRWDEDVLKFYAEEAWGATDLNEVLKHHFPDIKVYFRVEEEGCEVFATNDKEGKYFPERYVVTTSINGDDDFEYFTDESSMYEYIKKRTNGKVSTAEEAEKFNSRHEEDEDDDENYISIFKYDIVD